MNMNRNRPPKGCDLELWLSGTINDAIRDCCEHGMSASTVCLMLLIYARSMGRSAMISRESWERMAGWWGNRG